ncbi:hypothetical protein BLEM_2066 [Bifidobacterium lemurum]|uniref:Uncharacterized protein n=1 Tax=Bifidobacterium lemurum TaxID=1603886 RepID=A0A261FL52_9BIFI|nr:hypothetical protein [Bifidobacterium lemurum]OZG59891.1 hypothetical protein BLEM_2066 [Bifidobacterium lemurum]QOL33918.1 hypothetical protein BL8807_09155 [Bifidobacterium lemurum]
MQRTTILTAKMRDEFARLVHDGKKRYEVRTEPLDGAQAIRYVSALDGRELGMYRIGKAFRRNRDDDDALISLAAISPDDFHALFPRPEEGGPSVLWIAEILGPTTIEQLMEDER